MKDFRFSFLVCEFDMDDIITFPENSGIPEELQHEVKLTGRYMLRALLEFQVWYDTKILFCGNKDNAFLVTNSIFKITIRVRFIPFFYFFLGNFIQPDGLISFI